MINCYNAQGTIRVKIESERVFRLFFFPHQNSIVCSGCKNYAVFIWSNATSSDCDALLRELKENECNVEIKIDDRFQGNTIGAITSAAKNQTLVEIQVEEATETKCLSLAAITIPARPASRSVK